MRTFVKLLAFGCAVVGTPASAQRGGPEWETFGDWKVAKVSDEMDPVSHVVLRTTFTPDAGEVFSGPYDFGFRIFGRSLITLDVDLEMAGKNFWPHCDFESSSYSVDGSSPEFIATVDDPGNCDDVSMSVINRFKAGSEARLKLRYTTGSISLKGFTAAWNRFRQLSHQ